MNFQEQKDFLDRKYLDYHSSSFIELDPVSVPHHFSKKQDIEIAGMLAATIAWGQRKTILMNAAKLLQWMENDPHRFILDFTESDLKPFRQFAHRTFNGEDCVYFIRALQNIYKKEGLEKAFRFDEKIDSVERGIQNFKKEFFLLPHSKRTEKHVSSPASNSACKRMNMFLRWMVRKDSEGIDFGIWKSLKPSQLICPLDVHSGRSARGIGLLNRKQDDWKAAMELTVNLRKFSKEDPVRYDFALFGLGIDLTQILQFKY